MKYYLATNEVDVFHYGEMEDGMELTTGQPVSFIYDTEEELIAKLAEYGQVYQETQAPDNPLPPSIDPDKGTDKKYTGNSIKY
jgi:hypothetical protein